ncbi:MAG: MBOAT family protein [Sedimentisphaerales bacterium]|nr:MBOAT family protein [Sedimentisphaerales bacterium]
MLFNSLTFGIFFIIVFGLYWLLRRSYRWQNVLLLVASYLFYGWWDVRFLVLIVISTVVSYYSALSIENKYVTLGQRLRASGLIIFSSLAFLGFRWSAVDLAFSGGIRCLKIDWTPFLAGFSEYRWTILTIVLATVLVNAAHPFLQSLTVERHRKVLLGFSVVTNLTILGFFKYYNFFIDNFSYLAESLFGHVPNALILNVVLPVGISFFTFQTMSYAIDVYRKNMTASPSLIEVAVYVSFFPQLVAGPIERGKHLLPQFQRPRTVDAEGFRDGVWLIAWGLYKKIVVADNMALIVNDVFGPFDNMTSVMAVPEDGMRMLVAIYAFAFQIYCDFSGYTDIARGTAKLLGFDIMLNFNLPYISRSPSEFWSRWHISLSSWLRDYLYIPLGGNRGGTYKTYRNLMITMLLGGLWHGAAWTFVLWGAFHGAILVVYRIFVPNMDKQKPTWWLGVIQGLVMFHLVCLGWLIFRAQNLATIGIFLKSIVLHPHWSPDAIQCLRGLVYYSWFLILFQSIQGFSGKLSPITRWPWFARLNVWVLLIVSLISLAAKSGQEFIYFAF